MVHTTLAHPRTQLRVAGILDQPVNPYFERIFETGVDEMSWDDLSKNDMEWPSLKEVCVCVGGWMWVYIIHNLAHITQATAYRKTVYELVRNVINTHPDFDNLPITWVRGFFPPLFSLSVYQAYVCIHSQSFKHTPSCVLHRHPTILTPILCMTLHHTPNNTPTHTPTPSCTHPHIYTPYQPTAPHRIPHVGHYSWDLNMSAST